MTAQQLSTLAFLAMSIVMILVPLGMLVAQRIRWRQYNEWSEKNPEAHKRRVREYIETRRSFYDKPWG